ncbi:MAG: helix-turn-helix domain-containing protein [Acidimicrobiia bacterium]|nr:helix-turn-helix domain-containing protein [Acidimicrobiia bacterium]
MTSDSLWGPQDVANFLGVPLKTVYGWRHARIGPPAYKVGRHLRYDPEQVQRWLEAQAQPQGAA